MALKVDPISVVAADQISRTRRRAADLDAAARPIDTVFCVAQVDRAGSVCPDPVALNRGAVGARIEIDPIADIS